MNTDKSEKINLISWERSHSGLRIVHSNINRRTTDIFNSKGNCSSKNPEMYRVVKKRAIEMDGKLLDENIISKSPYVGGYKNEKYIPQNLLTSEDLQSITNPSGKNKNYNEILERNKLTKHIKENESFKFYKPESAINYQKVKKETQNKLASNRSYLAPNPHGINRNDVPHNKSAIVLRVKNSVIDNNKSNMSQYQNTTFDFNVNCLFDNLG